MIQFNRKPVSRLRRLDQIGIEALTIGRSRALLSSAKPYQPALFAAGEAGAMLQLSRPPRKQKWVSWSPLPRLMPSSAKPSTTICSNFSAHAIGFALSATCLLRGREVFYYPDSPRRTMPFCQAYTAACVRSARCNLLRILLTCPLTVCSLITSSWAI